MILMRRISACARWVGAVAVSAALVAMTPVVGAVRAQRVVLVSTVDQLYEAVNNPANQGAVIELVPGEYVLTPLDQTENPRPNLGSLVLPAGSILRGQNEYTDIDGDGIWDPPDPSNPAIYANPATETIINAVQLTGLTSVMDVISIGLDNQVEGLTVRNNTWAGALIGVTIKPSTGGLRGAVRNCIVEGGQRGIRTTHTKGFSGLHSSAVFEGNISRHHSGTFGFGFQVQNDQVADATWDVILRNNRSYGNKAGLFIVAVSSSNAEESVLSANNIYERNTIGVALHAGRDAAGAGRFDGSIGSQLRFDSVGDAIWNNNGNQGPDRGGVDARAGFRTSASATPSSKNHLRLQLIGTRFVRGTGLENLAGTTRRDLTLYGALGRNAVFPGSGNLATLLIRNSTSDGAPGAFLVVDSDPPAPNQAIVIGSDQAIESANTGIALDPPGDVPP